MSQTFPARRPSLEAFDKGRATDPSSCPHCGTPLTDPSGLGLCAVCGYCRTREEVRARSGATSRSGDHSRLWAREFGHVLLVMPGWMYIIVAGVVAIVLVSLAADFRLAQASAERAYFATGQIAL